jgi:hypothetical protein
MHDIQIASPAINRTDGHRLSGAWGHRPAVCGGLSECGRDSAAQRIVCARLRTSAFRGFLYILAAAADLLIDQARREIRVRESHDLRRHRDRWT